MFRKEIKITEENICTIYSECDDSNIENFLKNRNIVIISDTNINNLYKFYFKDYPTILLEAGEKSKTFSNVEYIISKLLEKKIDKSYMLIALGGGTICDITGFVASIYKRGISVTYVPTTILAQIDAAIGGKTGVNYNSLKNCVGTFKLAEFVFCNYSFFNTLEENEVKSAFGEILKYSLINDKLLFENLYKRNFKYFERDRQKINEIIKQCIEIKLEFVKKDFYDKEIRHVLNFGHSLGHAFEITDGLAHGIAIVKGMCAAIDLSYKLKYLDKIKLDLIKDYFRQYEFDTNYFINQEHINLLFNDKKKNNNEIEFILLKDISHPIIVKLRKNIILDIFNDNRN